MALSPKDRYPGQITTGDSGYPYGKARNRTAPGDGTGTPFEKDLVNDVLGFQQALLAQAAITPSGSPDHVGASQYVDAIQGLAAFSAVKNWKYQQIGIPNQLIQSTLIRDPQSRKWFAFGGTTATASWTCSGARWNFINTGVFGDLAPLMPVAQAAWANAAGTILAGGAPLVASTGKIRESTDGGETWSTVRNIGASDTNSVNALTYSESLTLWFCSVAGNGLFSSADRIAWTLRAAAGAPPTHFIVREIPTPILLATQPQIIGGSNNYYRSTNGTAWTTESFPPAVGNTVCQGCWSDAAGAFFVGGADGIYTSATGLTGSWTRIDTTWATPSVSLASIAAFGRLLIRGDGRASADGGLTWQRVLEVTDTDLFVRATPFGVAMARGISGATDLYISYQIGF